jgi:hypothetical protein
MKALRLIENVSGLATRLVRPLEIEISIGGRLD